MVRVERWNRRTLSRSSRRLMALPMADADTPSCRPAAVKLRVSAACTKALSELRLSMDFPHKFYCGHYVRFIWNYSPIVRSAKSTYLVCMLHMTCATFCFFD